MISVKSNPYMVYPIMSSYSAFKTLSFIYQSIELEKLYKMESEVRKSNSGRSAQESKICL